VLVLASVTVNVSGRLTSHDSVGILDSVGGVGAAIGNMGVHTASQPARPPGKHDARPAKRESILWIANHDGTREFTFHESGSLFTDPGLASPSWRTSHNWLWSTPGIGR
jgi:hypothetical protein